LQLPQHLTNQLLASHAMLQAHNAQSRSFIPAAVLLPVKLASHSLLLLLLADSLPQIQLLLVAPFSAS
jgi:hypothetical protein